MKYELPSIELIVIEENNYLKFGEYLNDMQCDDTTNKLSLDDLEYVKKLQQQNKQLQERIEYLERSIVRKEETITELEQEQVPYTNEYADKVDKENKKLNGAIQTYDILLKANVEENKQLKRIIKENTILVKDEYGDYQECNINPLRMKQKYEKQVDNWNKLKEFIVKEYYIYLPLEASTKSITILINKMQELEGSDSDEQRNSC